MVGEGLRMWMRLPETPGGETVPSGTLHEVQLPPEASSSTEASIARLWFGRMFFPPRDALIQHGQDKGRLTFNEYRWVGGSFID